MSDQPTIGRPLIGFITGENAPQFTPGADESSVDVGDAPGLGQSLPADADRQSERLGTAQPVAFTATWMGGNDITQSDGRAGPAAIPGSFCR